MANSIGPMLPPGWKPPEENSDSESLEQVCPALPKSGAVTVGQIGPTLPPKFLKESADTCEKQSIGPSVPPWFKSDAKDDEDLTGPGLSADSSDPKTSCALGPTLPTAFKDSAVETRESIGPSLPPWLKSVKATEGRVGPVGPSLPPEFLQDFGADEPEDGTSIGPSLPPSIQKSSIGPALPPGFSQSRPVQPGRARIGPTLPPGLNPSPAEDDDFDVIGPMPYMAGAGEATAVEEFERRSKKMRDKLSGKDSSEGAPVVERESWMTELPSDELGRSLGLVQRKFTTGIGSCRGEDRSGWTDTPADKARKEKEGKGKKRPAEDVEYAGSHERDSRMRDQVEQYNMSQRKESLMDMHTEKLKKKREETKDVPKERRPFSREEDLGTNKFDDAQRKSIIKKARGLDSRFDHGKQKFV